MIRKKAINKTIVIFLGIIFLAVILFPFYWTVFSSLKGRSDIVTWPPKLFPVPVTFENYSYILDGPFLGFLLNSLKVSVATVVIALILATPAAFAIARLEFPGQHLLPLIALLLYMFPTVVIIVPIFNVASKLGLLNSLGVLVIIYVALTVPFCMWLLSAFLKGIPRELEEQAMVDGASRFGALFRITLPLSIPGMSAAGLFVFITAWGEYLFSFLLISKDGYKTLPVGLNYWMSSIQILWGPLTAASVISTLPVLLLFSFLGKYFVASLSSIGIKG